MKVTTTNQPDREFEADRDEVQSLRRLGILDSVEGVKEGGEATEEEDQSEEEVQSQSEAPSDSPKSKNRHRAGTAQNQESPDSATSGDVTKSEEG